ncbi:DUF305 domain-containing protein [Actinoplanes sp. ATCC 53533]|nr:DUF305 domain-containing protein [Actinoplanes sp. ATCC 53533]
MLLTTGLMLGARPAGPPEEDSAAVGFCRDMAVHHQQAVELSLVLRDRSTDDKVRLLAYDVIGTQATQRGMLLGWLASWGSGLSAGGESMAWMGMPGTGTPMPGMATREQIAGLARAAPGEVDVAYLRLLITHHLGGVHMTDGLLRAGVTGTPPEVRRLAEAMRASQRAEIGALRDMLAERERGLR